MHLSCKQDATFSCPQGVLPQKTDFTHRTLNKELTILRSFDPLCQFIAIPSFIRRFPNLRCRYRPHIIWWNILRTKQHDVVQESNRNRLCLAVTWYKQLLSTSIRHCRVRLSIGTDASSAQTTAHLSPIDSSEQANMTRDYRIEKIILLSPN